MSRQYEETQEKLGVTLESQNALRMNENVLKEQVEEMNTKMHNNDIERNNLQNSTRELEIRYEKEMQEEKALYDKTVRDNKVECQELQVSHPKCHPLWLLLFASFVILLH